MIKVIKYGEKRHTCPYCKSILSYEAGDAKWKDYGRNEVHKVLRCPVCGKESEVN